ISGVPDHRGDARAAAARRRLELELQLRRRSRQDLHRARRGRRALLHAGRVRGLRQRARLRRRDRKGVTMTKDAEYAKGLRELANFIEAHPELPVPDSALTIFPGSDDKATAASYARTLAPCEKDYGENMVTLRRAFGPVLLEVPFWRTAVCRRVV